MLHVLGCTWIKHGNGISLIHITGDVLIEMGVLHVLVLMSW